MDPKEDLHLLVWHGILEKIVDSIHCDRNESIYHYTSPDGLLGIVQNEQVWFGNILDMNDITEINYALENVIIPTVKGSPNISNYSRSKILEKLSIVRGHNLYFEQERKAVSHEASIYVLSTSLNSNSHNLWNMYTKTSSRGGYAISMSVKDIVMGIYGGLCRNNSNKSGITSTMLWGEVIYDNKKQCDLIENFLLPIEEKIESRNDDFKEILFKNIAQGLYVLSTFMKDKDFSQVNEVRFLIVAANETFGVNANDIPYIKFLNNNGAIVSKLVMPFDISKIKKIVVSPYMLEQSHVENDLNIFLSRYGVKDFDIVINEKRKLR